MNKNSIKKSRKKIYMFIDIFLILLIIYFLYNFINGNNGIINLIKINRQIKDNNDYLINLKKNCDILLMKNKGLYEETINLDLLEEEAKNSLGYISQKNEFVIFLNE